MINKLSNIPAAYGLVGTKTSTRDTNSTSSEMASSFKELLSTMMLTNSLQSSDSQSTTGMGMGDMVTPLMLMLLEKMIAQQVDTSQANQSTADSSSAANVFHASRPVPSGRPVGGVLTQDFHPGHNGLDFGIVEGTPVKATMEGKVISAGWNDQGYGNLVIVQNGDYQTYYAHLSSIPVKAGDLINAGSTIGLSGNTGRSTGPHLHYEIRKNDVPIDPTSVTLGKLA